MFVPSPHRRYRKASNKKGLRVVGLGVLRLRVVVDFVVGGLEGAWGFQSFWAWAVGLTFYCVVMDCAPGPLRCLKNWFEFVLRARVDLKVFLTWGLGLRGKKISQIVG